MNEARGYISSGVFRGERVPQHIQNSVIRSYCLGKGLRYVLSRAEYSFEEQYYSQLWAAIKEGIHNIVLYSLNQLPEDKSVREEIYKECQQRKTTLHFACETEVLTSENLAKIEEVLLLSEVSRSYSRESEMYLKEYLAAEGCI